jgi:exodeoxyribonuclease VII large subunit
LESRMGLSQTIASSVTVSELNLHIKRILDGHDEIQGLWIRGEIADLHHHIQSGHIYFSLKDPDSRLKCVMFKGDAVSLLFHPREGMSVLAYGDVSVYARGGAYQLYVRQLLDLGDGSLARSFEEVRRRLADDGLLDEARKRPLPQYPKRIAVITSPEGAAIKDVVAVLQRRYPLVELVVVPCAVQGDAAVESIVQAMDATARDGRFDVGILTRGGGAADDLWVFNDERIARRLAAMPFPMICAVGHERDFTICDLVADLRAPTPSAAAELAVPDRVAILHRISQSELRARRSILNALALRRSALERVRASWVLRRTDMLISGQRQSLEEAVQRLSSAVSGVVEPRATQLRLLSSRLDSASPLKTLSRGYSIVTEASTGRLIVSVDQVSSGDRIAIRVADGTFGATVSSTGGDSGNGDRDSKLK